MSDDHAEKIAGAVQSVLREQMHASPATRSLLIALAEWVLAEADRIEGSGPEPSEPRPDPPARPAPPQPREKVPVRIGDASGEIEVTGSADELARAHEAASEEPESDTDDRITGRDVDLGLVTRRAALKAESCRVFVEWRRAGFDEVQAPELKSEMDTLLREAKSLENCFLWVFWRDKEPPSDAALREIGACYRALSESAALCSDAIADDTLFSQDEVASAFQMLAEADSALRRALLSTWLTKPDRDQDEAHLWLREHTYYREIFVPRYMKIDDPADPSRAEELIEEIRALAETIARRKEEARRVVEILNKIRYHAKKTDAEGRLEPHDARTINESFDALVSLGLRPGDRRLEPLCDLVSLDAFPGDEPPSERLLAFAEGCAHETDPPAPNAEAPPDPGTKWSERVLDVRDLLRGGRVVIIGGEKRPDAVERIKDAFELGELDWISITEHGSSEPMRAPIFRNDTRLVIVLIKLSGHLHIEDATRYAREAGVPLVRLPAGYNPEQIAEQVLSQAGDRLAAAEP
ncbi:MAG TPA: hypothetical protein ENK11_01345 [Phycisphaerales bacterium]|nr:hypothetical protein [Phycisphaerales bacterium]